MEQLIWTPRQMVVVPELHGARGFEQQYFLNTLYFKGKQWVWIDDIKLLATPYESPPAAALVVVNATSVER